MIKFNESEYYFYAKDLIKDLEEICSELNIEYIKYVIQPDTDIRIKTLGLYLRDTIDQLPCIFSVYIQVGIPFNPIDETISNSKKSTIVSVLQDIETLISSYGLLFKYKLIYKKIIPKNNLSRHLNLNNFEYSHFTNVTTDNKPNMLMAIEIIFDKK